MRKKYIPTINISKLNLECISSKNNDIFKQIQKACIEVGFFQIVGHRIEKNLIKQDYNRKQFHDKKFRNKFNKKNKFRKYKFKPKVKKNNFEKKQANI